MLNARVHRWVRERVGGRRNLAAFLVVLLSSVIIVVPIFAFLFLLFTQGAQLLREFAARVQEFDWTQIREIPLFRDVSAVLDEVLPESTYDGMDGDFVDRVSGLAQDLVQYLLNYGVQLFGDLADLVAKFFIFLFLLFYIVRDGEQMVANLRRVIPMKAAQTDRIFERIQAVTRAVVFGALAMAVLQGGLGAVGLAIVGIPPLVWGTLMGFSSMIPVVGTGLVSVPTTAYLFLTQQYWEAAFFFVWGIILVGAVDNYVRPFIMRGPAQMSPFFVFLSIIGGLATFALPGLVYGPLIIAFAIIMVQIFRDEYQHQLSPGAGTRAG
jgi:predicted PurR-regulated permease PerM